MTGAQRDRPRRGGEPGRAVRGAGPQRICGWGSGNSLGATAVHQRMRSSGVAGAHCRGWLTGGPAGRAIVRDFLVLQKNLIQKNQENFNLRKKNLNFYFCRCQ